MVMISYTWQATIGYPVYLPSRGEGRRLSTVPD